MWLAQVGSERLDEIADPEKAISRGAEYYRAKGYPEGWINQRLQTIEMRKELTDEWKARGITKEKEYAILTNDMTRAWSGMSVQEYKQVKDHSKMNKIIFILISLLLVCVDLFAIKPERTYQYTPSQYGLRFQTLSIETDDGATLSAWHIPPKGHKNKSTPIIIVNSDAGNMGNWLTLAYYLNYLEYDVWMFDWRGFGESSDFETKHEMLFCYEYVRDLKAVLDKVNKIRKKPMVIMGYSMGTLVIEEYLKQYPHTNISSIILDGYVGNPYSFVSNMEKQGKIIELPEGYEFNDIPIDIPTLIVSAELDANCPKESIPTKNQKIKVIEFDCGHIMALSTSPDDYIRDIHTFIQENR